MKQETLRCSFCGKSQDAVEKLISSPAERPGTYICDGCVRVCAEILEREDKPKPPDDIPEMPPTRIPLWVSRMFRAGKSD